MVRLVGGVDVRSRCVEGMVIERGHGWVAGAGWRCRVTQNLAYLTEHPSASCGMIRMSDTWPPSTNSSGVLPDS